MVISKVQTARDLIELGTLWSEKCELARSKEVFLQALELARVNNDIDAVMESLSSLLRLSGDSGERDEMERYEKLLDEEMEKNPRKVPALAWYCKGAVAFARNDFRNCLRYLHRYLKTVRREAPTAQERKEKEARGWLMIANVFRSRNQIRRAELLVQKLLKDYEKENCRGVNGVIYMLLGYFEEKRKNFPLAWRWYQKAQAAFQSERNWYNYLYVLYAYARLARAERNPSQAYWYLDLVEKTASGPEFGYLQKEILRERKLLEQDKADLVIDVDKAVVKTRDGGSIPLGKQYVLLGMLEALTEAHESAPEDSHQVGGLSKSEIIEKVWGERYRPEAHDNKLYYNINRLRKLLEPDMKTPKYLLNWKEGYRLAPGLRVQVVGFPRGKVQTGSAGGQKT